MALVAAAVPAAAAASSAPATAAPGATDSGVLAATLRPGAGATLGAWSKALLDHSTELGPSRASAVSVLVQLRQPTEPTALETWAAAHSLLVTWFTGDDWATVTGPASALAGALRVHIDNFRAAGGRTFYAATSAPRPPVPSVASVGSINSYGHFEPLDVPTGGLTPDGLRAAYDISPLTSKGFLGQGETIVFYEVDGFKQSDLDTFTSHFHLPPMNVTVIGGQAGPPGGETELDLETAHSIAPLAKLVYVNFLTNSASDMANLFKSMSNRFPGAMWSLSLGGCELEWGFSTADFEGIENAMASAVAQGTTIFISSGDSGGLECTPTNDFGQPPQNSFVGVSLPADFPAAVSVGGTRLDVTTTGAYGGEEAWTEPLLSQGTGGGVSAVWGPPRYQTGPGTGNFGQAHPGRQVPDVSALADPATGPAQFIGGNPAQPGGTSLAAPLWAASMALVDQYLAKQGVAPKVVVADVAFYQLARNPRPLVAFHDITRGGNVIYPATRGYDMTTGVGSPDVFNLARDLVVIK
jgi:kumamolisin